MMQKVLHSQKNRSYRNTHRGTHAGRQSQQTIYLTVREVSGMEESLDVVQVREEEVPLDESTEEMTEQENDPPAARGAYVVSKPTVTDDDLSDTKDENLLGLISRKRKKNKSE